ncbi:hypothetical protein R3P38DRAFT_3201512 [Favolaschia claudopus]|uniref:F-box domain-containing protein n=1 Tax=Favolaschia claudopus TaxID=2862362 RepID=A0AAW0AXY6_9AGAR
MSRRLTQINEASYQEHLRRLIGGIRADIDAARSRTEAITEAIGERMEGITSDEMHLLVGEKLSVGLEIGRLTGTLVVLSRDISPVARVPLDVLLEIFLLTEHNRQVNGRGPIPTAPWRLGHVCRSWRDAALGYPLLWTDFTFNSVYITACYKTRPNPALEYPLAAVQAQLRLSCAAPISVAFRMHGQVGSPEDLGSAEHVAALWDILIPESHRWFRLSLSATGWSTAVPLAALPRIRGRLDQLQHLVVGGIATEWETVHRDVFAVAPRLRQVEFDIDVSFMEAAIPLTFPWAQLTHLQITAATDSGLDFLPSAQNLQRLTYHVPVDSFPERPSTPFTLPHLSDLTLGIYGDEILSCLSSPNLRRVALDNTCEYTEVPEIQDEEDRLRLLAALIRRSGCSLETLRFESIVETAETLAVLELCPNLTSLYLGEAQSYAPSVLPEMFVALTLEPGATPLCTKVGSFGVDHWHNTSEDFYNSLCHMIESRWNIPSDLRYLKNLDLPSYNEPPFDTARLESLARDGLCITRFHFRTSPVRS